MAALSHDQIRESANNLVFDFQFFLTWDWQNHLQARPLPRTRIPKFKRIEAKRNQWLRGSIWQKTGKNGVMKRTRGPLRKIGLNGGCKCQQFCANVSSSVHKESMLIRSQDMGDHLKSREKLCRPFQALHRGWGWKGKQFPTHSTQRERHRRICALFIQSQEYILSKRHYFSVSAS